MPQDNNRMLGGARKAVYATDDDGHYGITPTTGWQVEEIVTALAHEDFDHHAADALQRARNGETAPLEYHMYRLRMDRSTLAQAAGLWRWRVKRHLRPKTFNRLPRKLLERYAAALGIGINELKALPDE